VLQRERRPCRREGRGARPEKRFIGRSALKKRDKKATFDGKERI